MSDFVLDCSVTISWIVADEQSDYAESILRLLATQDAIVPSIWSLEVANVLLVAERRNRMTQKQVLEALSLLETLEVEVDDLTAKQALGTTLALGRQEGLAAYDAAYLELALRLGLRLATLDTRLAEAATRCKVELVNPAFDEEEPEVEQ